MELFWLSAAALALGSVWLIFYTRKKRRPHVNIRFNKVVPTFITGFSLRAMYLESTVTHVTDSCAGMCGLEPEDMIGQKMRDYKNTEITEMLDMTLKHGEMINIRDRVVLETRSFVLIPEFGHPADHVRIYISRSAVEARGVLH